MSIKENLKSAGDFKDKFQEKWIKDFIDTDCMDYLESFGLYLCDKSSSEEKLGRNAITTSQIRNIFGEVKRIQMRGFDTERQSFVLLPHKIAYNSARVLSKSNQSRIKDFRTIVERAHGCVTNKEQFERFASFFEGIVAYHKVYGGKD